MKRKKKKKSIRRKNLKKFAKTESILPLLIVILFLGLFSEIVRTLPVGAFSEKLQNIPYEIPRLNSSLIEEKLLKKDDYQRKS